MAKELKGKRKKVKGTAKSKVVAGKKKRWAVYWEIFLVLVTELLKQSEFWSIKGGC